MAKKVLALDDLSLDTIYLTTRYYNSKTITWQPCKVLSKIAANDRIAVEFMDDAGKDIVYVRDGKCADSMGRPTLKIMDQSWVNSTLKREQIELDMQQKRVDFLKSLVK